MTTVNTPLLVGAAFSLLAASLHFACVFWGSNGFRVLGAGDRIVSLSAAGHWFPPFVALTIGSILIVWALYALSGAGTIPPLPFLRVALVAITSIYLLRAMAFPMLKPIFPGNSSRFWLVSSAISLSIGLAHLVGLIQVWEHL